MKYELVIVVRFRIPENLTLPPKKIEKYQSELSVTRTVTIIL